MLRCPTGPEVVGVHNLLRDALAGLMRDAGYRAIMEVSNVMPITTDFQGGHHRRTLDIVGVQPGGGPRALVDVVVTEAYKSSASTHIAGHAVGGAEQKKLRHYSDYPRSDHLLPAAIDTFGCLGPRFHTLLENIASLGYARREDMLPAQMGMPAAYVSFLRRRVSTCLQRAQAYALHQKAGRALAAGTRASQLPCGIRASASDLYIHELKFERRIQKDMGAVLVDGTTVCRHFVRMEAPPLTGLYDLDATRLRQPEDAIPPAIPKHSQWKHCWKQSDYNLLKWHAQAATSNPARTPQVSRFLAVLDLTISMNSSIIFADCAIPSRAWDLSTPLNPRQQAKGPLAEDQPPPMEGCSQRLEAVGKREVVLNVIRLDTQIKSVNSGNAMPKAALYDAREGSARALWLGSWRKECRERVSSRGKGMDSDLQETDIFEGGAAVL
eukprot:SM000046S16378  [mRNA]  locus=s46:256832:262413:- [translate_table: standard]